MESVLMLFAMLAWFNVHYKNRTDVTNLEAKGNCFEETDVALP